MLSPDFSLGYPSEDSLYLEFLYIQSEIQKQGYGQELIQALTLHCSELGYKEIRINVALINWPALRFWIKSGINKISLKNIAKGEYTNGNFLSLQLDRA
ncbi:GNAT family N-acetyltransferase [Priestia sp. FSL H7-0729]